MHHRQIGREVHLGSMRAREFGCALKGGSDDFADDREPQRLGTIAPDSSRVMSSRLAMKRFSRSDSSMIVADEFCLGLIVERTGKVPQRPGGAEDCRQRRLEIVRDRGEQRLPEPIGFGGELGALDVLDEVHALDRERSLVDECIKQPALLRR